MVPRGWVNFYGMLRLASFLRYPHETSALLATFAFQLSFFATVRFSTQLDAHITLSVTTKMQGMSSFAARDRSNPRPIVAQAVSATSKTKPAASTATSSVKARVDYARLAPDGKELFWSVYEKPKELDRATNLECVGTEVCITDLRPIEREQGRFTLADNGFQLEKLDVPADIDWADDDDVSLSRDTLPS